MGGRCDVADAFEEFDVFRVLAEFVVADQGSKRRAAEDAELFFVHLEHRALIELRGALEVAKEVFFETLRTLIFNMSLVSLWSIMYFNPRQEPSSFWNEG